MQLSDRLVKAWSYMDVPQLSEELKTHREFGRYFKFVDGRTWYELDVTQRKLSSECWILHLPPAVQLYYFGSFLKYCLDFYSDNKEAEFPDADIPFHCMISTANKLIDHRAEFSDEQQHVIAEILDFAYKNLSSFGFGIDQDVRQELEFAIATWTTGREDAISD